jgi:hypothetical protein
MTLHRTLFPFGFSRIFFQKGLAPGAAIPEKKQEKIVRKIFAELAPACKGLKRNSTSSHAVEILRRSAAVT